MELLKKIIANTPETSVNEVIIGDRSVLVHSEDHAGMANRISRDPSAEIFHSDSKWKAMNLRKLAEYSLSDNLLEAAIGMAAINCGLDGMTGVKKRVNAKEIILKKGKNKVLGIIGHFPFLDEQKDHFSACYIFEKYPHKGDLKESDIAHYLPKADVVAITGTTMTNHTFDNIYNSLPKSSYNIMLGPSTPLSPLLFDHGMDMVSSTRVMNYRNVKEQVLMGTPTRYLTDVEMVSIFKEDYR
jgi:uncharacterized protein (DUF4213/DUF364 family)